MYYFRYKHRNVKFTVALRWYITYMYITYSLFMSVLTTIRVAYVYDQLKFV